MNGDNNSGSNANYNYNNDYSAYSYGQYPDYYYQQYYANTQYPQQQQQQQRIPQGDPSAALSTITYQYQQQQQQQQQQHYPYNAYSYPTDYYGNYYAAQNQRSMIHYGDLSHDQQPQSKTPGQNQAPVKKEPELEKPKFCCFKTLKSMMAITQHEKLHVKCPSCDFKCLPSILHEHEETYHGKAPKEPKKSSRPDGIVPPHAPKLDTPEELASWIAARKKNWPSQSNVEKKEQEIAEKIARGEIIPSQKRKNDHRNQQQVKKQKVEDLSDESSEDDMMDPEKDAVTSKDPSVMGKILLPEDRPKRKCKYFMMGRCKKGDACTYSHELSDKPKHPKQPRVVNPIRKRPNLLFKLLEKEILQEKSVILQCLRYIVDNNFLEAEPVKTSS